jgi:hypothetical protein
MWFLLLMSAAGFFSFAAKQTADSIKLTISTASIRRFIEVSLLILRRLGRL